MKTIEELSELSDDELRVMCAETLGWVNLGWGWRTPEGIEFGRGMISLEACVPNYPADLNVMHEAVMSLDGPDGKDERHQYRGWLKGICGTSNDAIDATARQRCIAYTFVKQPHEKEAV